MKTDLNSVIGSLIGELSDRARRDPDFGDRVRDALGVALGSRGGLTDLRSTLGTVFGRAGRQSKRAALNATGLVAANPKRVGLGLGAAAVAGVGLFIIAKTLESGKTDETSGETSGEATDASTDPGAA